MAITNKSLSTGTVANKNLGSSGSTWAVSTYTWAAATGTWAHPANFGNKAVTTATISNKALS